MCELCFHPLSMPHSTLQRRVGVVGEGAVQSAEDMVGQERCFLCFTVNITSGVGRFVSVVHWSLCSRHGMLQVIGCLCSISVLQPTVLCYTVYQLG